MITYRHASRYLGQHVQCHTHFGTFQGIVIHLSKHHIILGRVPNRSTMPEYPAYATSSYADNRKMMPPGPGGPQPPPPGGGWHMAIPIAAILGITAVGLHWW